MPTNALTLLSLIFATFTVVLVVVLLILLWKSQQQGPSLLRSLLVEQMVENQSLRNQLRAVSPEHLAHLNYATLPSNKVAHHSSDPVEIDPDEVGESLLYEEALARQGFETGDLGHDLESAGWSPSVIRRSGDGDPIAYDAT